MPPLLPLSPSRRNDNKMTCTRLGIRSLRVMAAFAITFAALSDVRMSAAELGQSPANLRWQSTMKEREEELKLAGIEFDALSRKLYSQANELNSMRTESEEWLSELSFMLPSTYSGPYEFRLLCKEVFARAKDARICADTGKELLLEFKDDDEWIHSMSDSLSSLAAISGSPETAGTSRRMLALLFTYQELIQHSHSSLVDALDKFQPCLAEWEAVSAKYEAKIPVRLSGLLLSPMESALDLDTWSSLRPAVSEWFAAAPLAVLSKLPDRSSDWAVIAIWMLASALLMRIGRMQSHRFPSWLTSIVTALHLKRAWVCLFAAVPLLCAVLSLEFPDTVVLTRLALALLAVAVMDFTWKIRHPDSGVASPLTPIFWLYFSGVVLQVLNVNPILLALVWPACCAVAMVAMVKRLCRHSGPNTGQVVLLVSIAICTVLMLLSAAGFTILSMLACYVFFVSLLAFQFGALCSRILAHLVLVSESRIGTVAKSVIIGIAVPALWFAVVGGAAAWVADQFIDLDALWRIISTRRNVGGVTISLPLLAGCIFFFFVFKAILAGVDGLLARRLQLSGGEHQSEGLLRPFKTVSAYIAWSIYAMVVLGLAGVSLTSLTVIAGGLSVGVGFGLQHLASNFISGLIILFGKSIRHGETILVDGKYAVVDEINMRNTIVKTRENLVITIPNSDILSKELVSATHYDPYIRVEVKVDAAYDADLGKAVALLMAAAANHPQVRKNPAPGVLISELGESAVELTLRVWIDVHDDPCAQSDLRVSVLQAFAAAGIEIPSHQVDITVRDSNRTIASLASQPGN